MFGVVVELVVKNDSLPNGLWSDTAAPKVGCCTGFEVSLLADCMKLLGAGCPNDGAALAAGFRVEFVLPKIGGLGLDRVASPNGFPVLVSVVSDAAEKKEGFDADVCATAPTDEPNANGLAVLLVEGWPKLIEDELVCEEVKRDAPKGGAENPSFDNVVLVKLAVDAETAALLFCAATDPNVDGAGTMATSVGLLAVTDELKTELVLAPNENPPEAGFTDNTSVGLTVSELELAVLPNVKAGSAFAVVLVVIGFDAAEPNAN